MNFNQPLVQMVNLLCWSVFMNFITTPFQLSIGSKIEWLRMIHIVHFLFKNIHAIFKMYNMWTQLYSRYANFTCLENTYVYTIHNVIIIAICAYIFHQLQKNFPYIINNNSFIHWTHHCYWYEWNVIFSMHEIYLWFMTIFQYWKFIRINWADRSVK